MKTIQKFRIGLRYSTLSDNSWYEPVQREGKRITFKVRKAGTSDTRHLEAEATFAADDDGAYEKVRFSDGTVVTAKTSSTRQMHLYEVSPKLREAVIKTLEGKRLSANGE